MYYCFLIRLMLELHIKILTMMFKFVFVFAVCAALFVGSRADDTVISTKPFPADFKFGAGGAAYQIEGAVYEDGRGPSIWDVALHENGHKTADDKDADVTCDSYHKYHEDVQILKDLGVDYYRLSIAWPRILPNGTINYINQKGIDYYSNVLKALNDSGIDVVVTLYHWDLPQHLQDLGGWTNPDIVDYFEDYARLIFGLFGDRVKLWGTINEPKSICLQGYGDGTLAPNLPLIGDGIYLCAYNVLRAHARAYHVYDNEFRAKQNGKVSIVINTAWAEPATDSEADKMAAERELQFQFGLYANAVYLGDWPQLLREVIGNRSAQEGFTRSRLPAFTPEEIQYINGTYDYFALNMYTGDLAQNPDYVCGISTNISFYNDKCVSTFKNASWPSSAAERVKSVPWGLRKLLNFIRDRYNPNEIIITENGWPDKGELDDQGRITYLRDYLSNLLDAIYEDGINVVGYTVWSLLDNFEWMEGYTQKYGIVQVDFDSPNRTRTMKASGQWYKNLIATRCLAEQCDTGY